MFEPAGEWQKSVSYFEMNCTVMTLPYMFFQIPVFLLVNSVIERLSWDWHKTTASGFWEEGKEDPEQQILNNKVFILKDKTNQTFIGHNICSLAAAGSHSFSSWLESSSLWFACIQWKTAPSRWSIWRLVDLLPTESWPPGFGPFIGSGLLLLLLLTDLE